MAHTIKRYPRVLQAVLIHCISTKSTGCFSSPLTANQNWGWVRLSAFRKKGMDKIHVRH